jgi:hypothetical protein
MVAVPKLGQMVNDFQYVPYMDTMEVDVQFYGVPSLKKSSIFSEEMSKRKGGFKLTPYDPDSGPYDFAELTKRYPFLKSNDEVQKCIKKAEQYGDPSIAKRCLELTKMEGNVPLRDQTKESDKKLKWCTIGVLYNVTNYETQYVLKNLVYAKNEEEYLYSQKYVYGTHLTGNNVLLNFERTESLRIYGNDTQLVTTTHPAMPSSTFYIQRKYHNYDVSRWKNECVVWLCEKTWKTSTNGVTSDSQAGTTDADPTNLTSTLSNHGALNSEVSKKAVSDDIGETGEWVYTIDRTKPYTVEILTCENDANFVMNGSSYIYRIKNKNMDIPYIIFWEHRLYHYLDRLVDIQSLPLAYTGTRPYNRWYVFQNKFLEFNKSSFKTTCDYEDETSGGMCKWLNIPAESKK